MAQYAAERAEAAAPAVANPAPLGLCAFALTTFVLSCVNAGVIVPASNAVLQHRSSQPIHQVNAGVIVPASNAGTPIVIGLALFYGGVAQILAGMWEFRSGNTFGATAFTSYGAFWIALGFTLLPGSGIAAALKAEGTLSVAVGLFLLGWTIFTGLMFLGTLRSNMALIAVFGLLFLAFLALTIGDLGGGSTFHVLGGWLGILTALAAWYAALAGLLASGKSAFTLPVGPRS